MQVIARVLSNHEVHTQAELRELLLAEDVYTTQGALSRDLAALGVLKRATKDGGALYYLPELKHDDVHLHFSGNLALLRTRPGYAGAIASQIDQTDISGILGTIAGDDTVLIILEETAQRTTIAASLQQLLEPLR